MLAVRADGSVGLNRTLAELQFEPGSKRCLTGDTVMAMGEATIRDLRNRGGEVIDRVAAGEHITITRDGKPVAELRPLPRRRLAAAAVVEHFRRLPAVDAVRLRADIDAVIDQSL